MDYAARAREIVRIANDGDHCACRFTHDSFHVQLTNFCDTHVQQRDAIAALAAEAFAAGQEASHIACPDCFTKGHAAGVAEARAKRGACIYRLKMARFVLAGLASMYPETRRSDIVRRMVEIIDATVAANPEFDAGDKDYAAALRASQE